jgi:adenosine deaminase
VVNFSIANSDTFVEIDFADQELVYPAKAFTRLFRETKDAGRGVTVHRGEISAEESQLNVREVIEQMAATRIGHGLHIVTESALNKLVIELVNDNNVTLELCPTSSVVNGSIPSINAHLFKQLMDLDVKSATNANDPALSSVDWNSEYALAQSSLGLSEADIADRHHKCQTSLLHPSRQHQSYLAHGLSYRLRTTKIFIL